jgi:hypothetical protein
MLDEVADEMLGPDIVEEKITLLECVAEDVILDECSEFS